jgi:hypothetical protein
MALFRKIKATWKQLKEVEPGERFQTFHEKQARKPAWVKVAFFALAFVAFGVGVVLAFIPGPAVVFFALSGALLSTQSRFVARALDRGEVWGRKRLGELRAWWRRKRRGSGRGKPRHARRAS